MGEECMYILYVCTDLDEKVHQLWVVQLLPEISLEDLEHTGLQSLMAMSCTSLFLNQQVAPPSEYAVVHDIISHEEECLQKFYAPTQCGGLAATLENKKIKHVWRKKAVVHILSGYFDR